MSSIFPLFFSKGRVVDSLEGGTGKMYILSPVPLIRVSRPFMLTLPLYSSVKIFASGK